MLDTSNIVRLMTIELKGTKTKSHPSKNEVDYLTGTTVKYKIVA